MTESCREKLEARTKEILKNDITGHDIHHSNRVYKLARKIGKGEKWAFDDDVLHAIAMLHDTGHLRCISEGDMQREKHMEYGVEIADKVLREIGFPSEKIKIVLEGIRLHDDTKPFAIATRTPTNVKEILLIQDADVLEAMGILGMFRILLYSYGKGLTLYNPNLSITENLDDSKNKSSVHNMLRHLNIDENFNTTTAKVLAQKKKASAHKLIEDFLEEFNPQE